MIDADFSISHLDKENPSSNRAISNLNKLPINIDEPPFYETKLSREKKSGVGEDGFFEAYFDDLEDRLIEHISSVNLVVGCVAWLTNKRILSALSGVKNGVSIIVQKEDFLRPDYGVSSDWKRRLREAYDNLPSPPCRYSNWGNPLESMSYACGPSIQPIRCMGNHNKNKSPAFPRMHHKFLVFCHYMDGTGSLGEIGQDRITPLAVWTGSFNFSENANNSMENAVFFNDPAVVSAYFNEWNQIAARSEPLDWTSEWAEPEWRIGS